MIPFAKAAIVAVTLFRPVPAVPQMPLATGTIESILPVIAAANKCGIVAIRTEARPRGLVSLFVNQDPRDRAAFKCAEDWIAKNADRLDFASVTGGRSRPK